ncbi:MAG: hypothetical protein JST64_12805, partial [Actinobacteria bacterium]|nr:hypothetical protein [Actinomycetota bacterium]
MDDLATLEPDALADELGPSTPTQRSRWSDIRRVHGDAGMLVVKHARSDGRAGLRREAEVLDAVGGSMLVRFVELRDLPDTTELVLRDTGGPSLASMLRDPATKPVDALTHLAETCETVARLHAAGWSHGRLGPDHVLMSARGRIRLCSLRAAMPIDVDPTVARDDRAALLRMVDDWVASASTHGSARRPASRFAAGRVARCTRRLADAPDPIVLARILRRCSRPLGPRPRVAAAVAAIAAATVGISLLAVTRSPPSSAERATTARATTRPATTRPASTPSTTTRPTTAPEASAGRSSPTPLTTAPPSNDAPSPAACADPGSPSDSAALAAAVDVDGDGCAEVV